jgi:hypothetical protein
MDFSTRTLRKPITEGYYSAHENRFIKSDTSIIKANDPEIYEVKLDKFSSRKSALFYMTAREPLPAEGKNVSHGGIYYNRDNQTKFMY